MSRAELIENIDIGGPTMIRAAAKNYQDVAVVVSPAQYAEILEELRSSEGYLSMPTQWKLAKEAFARTAAYDAAVTARLARETDEPADPADVSSLPETLRISAKRTASLRYGENPHQEAALYSFGNQGVAGAKQLHGKELSYNNLVDLDAAWQLVSEFSGPAAAIIKHTNPCGCAEQPRWLKPIAKRSKPIRFRRSAVCLAFNRPVDAETAKEVAKLFVEAIAAPGYSDEALQLLTAKKNLRLVAVRSPETWEFVVEIHLRRILAQTVDYAPDST
ncbi:MAG: hypothetical protein QM757_11490 [Paludibaculum sp.]